MPKITIKQNAWDNWYGYVGGRKVEQFFGNDFEMEANAKKWLEEQTRLQGENPEKWLKQQRKTAMSKEKVARELLRIAKSLVSYKDEAFVNSMYSMREDIQTKMKKFFTEMQKSLLDLGDEHATDENRMQSLKALKDLHSHVDGLNKALAKMEDSIDAELKKLQKKD